MTQIFEDGKFVPVTVVEAGPNFVLQKENWRKDGYVALQLGFDEKKEKTLQNLLMGIFNKAEVKPQRFVKELDVETVEGYEFRTRNQSWCSSRSWICGYHRNFKGKGTSGVMKNTDLVEIELHMGFQETTDLVDQ